MKMISILLFSISINLDNLPLSLYFLNQNQPLSLKQNIFLSLFVSFSTLLVMHFSVFFSTFFSSNLIHQILIELSCACLIIMGMLSIYQALFQTIKKEWNNKSMIKLSLSLLFNNIFAAIPAAIAGMHVFYSGLFNFILCLFFLEIAKKLHTKQALNRDLLFISGLLLIILGILS